MVTFTAEKEWFDAGMLEGRKQYKLTVMVSERTALQMHLCDEQTHKIYRRLGLPGAILMPGKQYTFNFITNTESRLHLMPMSLATVDFEVEQL
jgi:hypothetical protein